jgi:Lsr2
MTTVTQVKPTCDICGDTNEVKTRTFGLDGKAYEIDLCRKDGNALGKVGARYIAKSRMVTTKRRRRQHGGGPQEGVKTSRSQRQNAEGSSTTAASAAGVQQKGVDVYGILPADIEVAAGMPSVGNILAWCVTSAPTAWPP